jgi:AcrR family transcriptional regulator
VSEATVPIGRRERKKQQMRERILDEASALISDQGLAATTVDQIAERVDISQTTFFNYFPNKAALVEALVERLVDMWNGVVEEAHAANAPATEKIAILFGITADLTHSQHRLLRDLIVETVRAPANAPTGLNRMLAFFRQDVTQGQAQGEIRGDRDPEALADCVLGLYVSMLLFWTTEADYPIVERLRKASELAVDLVSPAVARP